MSSTAPALLAAAAGVGFGHAVLPDHWVPLAVIARTQRYPLRRVLRLSALAGVAHVALSLILGAIVIGVGLQFRSTVEQRESLVVGALLIATGVVFAALELRGRGHTHDHDHTRNTATRLLAFAIPFGAAASPDLTILPVFLAASTLGATAALGTLITFSLTTLTTIIGLTAFGVLAGYQLRGAWIDKSANLITAVVLLTIGVLVATGHL